MIINPIKRMQCQGNYQLKRCLRPDSVESSGPKKSTNPTRRNRSSSVLPKIRSGNLAVIATNALDPWICAPNFRQVCLYQINEEYNSKKNYLKSL